MALSLTAICYLNAHVLKSETRTRTRAESLYRYGFFLTDVAAQSGINCVHDEPVLDSKLSSIMPEVASMGASVTVVDYDQDGWDDIYVTNSAPGSQNHLYHNLHNGKFEDVAAKFGIADLNKPGTGACMGASWGDYDNDGYPDLLVYKWGRPELFHNDKGKGFTEVTEKARLPAFVNANSASWIDYNRDGKLDLLICGYYPDNVNLWHLNSTKMMPASFEYASNGGSKFLLKNLGNGIFKDVTKSSGIDSHRWTLAIGAADLFGSGYPDIVLANDYGVSQVYKNEGGTHFDEVGRQLGIGYAPKSGMDVSFGDIYDQGKQSIYVSNIYSDGNLTQGNNLWVPRGSGSSLHYVNEAQDAGVEVGGWSFGAQFVDLNNDGFQDLFLTNGYISADRNKSYWYDFSKISGGNHSIISDAANWPPIGNMSLSGYEQKRVWINDGFGKFTDVAQAVGVNDLHDGRAVAVSDLWNDGAMDVLVANQTGPLLVYRNEVDPKNSWVEFDLRGRKCNSEAVGAQVTLKWKNGQGQVLSQEQDVASSSGFCAQNSHRLHFGLGRGGKISSVTIKWPEIPVATQVIRNVPENTIVHIEEAR